MRAAVELGLAFPDSCCNNQGHPGYKPLMPKPCSERDRLRAAYYNATLAASASCAALPSTAFSPEFSAVLDKAEAAYLACVAARRAYEEHCEAHGCQAEFHGPLRSAAS